MSIPASYGTFSSFRKPPRDCHMSRVSRDDACMHFDPRKTLAENLYRVIFVRDQSNPHAWAGGNAAFKKAVQRALAGENTTVQTLAEIARRADLQPWHLLLPDLDPANPPVFVLNRRERELYASLKQAAMNLPPAPATQG